jgi:hypothetical protein
MAIVLKFNQLDEQLVIPYDRQVVSTMGFKIDRVED